MIILNVYSTYNHLDLYKNLNIIETEIINESIEIGDLVRIVTYSNGKIPTDEGVGSRSGLVGYLENIDDNTYTIKPIPEPDQDNSL